MSIDVTPWRPAWDTLTPARQVLAAAVRKALPAHKAMGTPEWAYGTRQEATVGSAPVARADAGVGIRLEWLTWRLRESLDFQQRAMGEWSFAGVGWVAESRVDFAGEYLRDFATGAFWEFRLLSME